MPTPTGQLATLGGVETLLNKTLTAPTITASDWTTATHAHTSDATGGAVSAGALTRAGGNTTEATTTSTTIVSLLTVASLNIPSLTPILGIASLKKTAGAAASASVGLTVNATVPREPVAWSSTANEADWGYVKYTIPPHDVTYKGGGCIEVSGTVGGLASIRGATYADYLPNAATTSFILNALVGNASVTMGADELHVYVLAVS